ncbi:uncharacterized protein LOC141655321 [Silene latifolia]|uniref:uncharacterized protein LOC141655321 n=1 Tax=Silene latifolia TaxID=37657 RepID=UPI003D776489
MARTKGGSKAPTNQTFPKRQQALQASKALVIHQAREETQEAPIPMVEATTSIPVIEQLEKYPEKGNNMIWVIVDRLTKTTHFIPMKDIWSKAELAKADVKNIVKLHGIPKDIVSDRDSRFISKYWQELQECIGTTLKMSIAFHQSTDGQTERTIQTLEDMFRACVLDFEGSWEERWLSKYIYRQKMRAAQDRHKSYADLKRSEIEFSVGDKVLLKVLPMKGMMRFDKRGKLSQKYIGPYEILDSLRKYVRDPTHVLAAETVEMDANLSYLEVSKEILDRKVRKTRNIEISLVKVLWSNHNVEEATWEVKAEIKEKYPHLFA